MATSDGSCDSARCWAALWKLRLNVGLSLANVERNLRRLRNYTSGGGCTGAVSVWEDRGSVDGECAMSGEVIELDGRRYAITEHRQCKGGALRVLLEPLQRKFSFSTCEKVVVGDNIVFRGVEFEVHTVVQVNEDDPGIDTEYCANATEVL